MDQVSNTMWKISRALRRTCEHSPPLRVGDTIIASPDIKANTLADNFARIHDNTQESDVETTAAVGESVHRISESCCVFQPSYLVRPKELKSFIRKLKKKEISWQRQHSKSSTEKFASKGPDIPSKNIHGMFDTWLFSRLLEERSRGGHPISY